MPQTVAEDVLLGDDLVTEQKRLDGESSERQTILGRYENRMRTDWEAAEHATQVAGEAIQLAHQLGSTHLPARLVDALCATALPSDKIRAAHKRLSDSYGSWQKATQELKPLLALDALPGVDKALEECA